MKKVFLTICYLSFAALTFAQEAPKTHEDSLRVGWWTRNTQLGFTFTGAAFSKSWQGGGINNLTLGGYFNNLAVYTKGKGVWTNDIQLQYGRLTNFYQSDTKEVRKGVDRIFLDTKYTRVVHKTLNWYSSLNFFSQFDEGFDYTITTKPIISKFLSPGFLTLASGLEWKPKPYLVTQLGLAGRTTFISNNATIFQNTQKLVNGVYRSYGVEKGQTTLTELGLQGVIAFDKDISKNINLKIRDQMFLALLPKSKPLDHNINLIATAKINKYFNVNLAAIFIRDLDQISKDDVKNKVDAQGKPRYKSVWQATGGFNLGFSLKL
ncbi:DUF3078 domain-containing protein [Emticicia sp. W12TSBA100-4]|uniref:DUF3078 domain-containing protein n=1 Tax=Emticicia sp. W12TSBA100-4 TaxID=3160965 RepID=UPI003305E321